MRTRNALQLATVGLGLVALACSENDPTGPDPGLLAARAQFQGPGAPSQALLSRQVPGFGGFFLDRDGTPTIYLTRGADRGPAERALGAYLTGRGFAGSDLRVREGEFTWQQLENWHGRATPAVLEIAGTVFVDDDESSNRVRIGVENLRVMALVRAAVTGMGIPEDALIIERADPIVQVATLQNVVDRPVRAGVQIHFGNYLCSVGYNATSASEQKSFITASHCTNVQGGVEGTVYYQPLKSAAPTAIGTEVADPTYFKNRNGCPRGRRCRFSDAARVGYANGADQGLGLIAQTSGPNNGSLTITGSFTITSADQSNSVLVGETVNKVGRTTGWTAGQVSGTCVNVGVSGTNIVQLCQTLVNGSGTIVGGGDSGSNVFQVTGGTNVELVGSLWGGNSNGTLFVYSPFANVQAELGSLTVF